RLPVRGEKTRKVGEKRHRILEGHIDVNGHQLVLLVGHWTSRVPKPGGNRDDENAEGRAEYGDVMYGRFRTMYEKNPDIDLLVAGDFNDDPDDPSVRDHLHSTGDRSALTSGSFPMLFNLPLGKDPNEFGTLNHNNRWNQFDQIHLSPGLLDDRGWTCLVDTFRAEREKMKN